MHLLFLSSLLASLTCSLVSSQYVSFDSSDFNVKLNQTSQTLASLSPKLLSTFDFSPFDVLSQRSANRNYHLGDITLRYRKVGATSWTSADSVSKRAAVLPLPAAGNTKSVSSLLPTLPANFPFNVTRSWGIDGGDVVLSVTLSNTASNPVEVGSFGFPIEFNSIFTGRTAIDTQTKCSLTDPNIGLHGGYLRVTPLSGTGPALVVTPLGNTPFEAWRFLPEAGGTSLSYQSQTFEGFYSWDVFSKAYTENEWKGTSPWNPGTSRVLVAGEQITLGLRFSVATGIAGIESVVARTNTPLAIGTPGYITPQTTDATLHVYYNSSISGISISPGGAMNISLVDKGIYKLSPNPNVWGRARVSIEFADNKTSVVQYYITKSASTALSDLGNFLTTFQWFNDTLDPFQRAPSVISYDRSANSQVVQEARAWIAGLSDEGGAGSWLAATLKQAAQPNANEVAKLEIFANRVLWGVLQQPDFSVRKSVFFYQPGATTFLYSSAINWGNWWSWNKAAAFDTSRAYDYVHVTAAYWALYRVARSYPKLVTIHDWQWYLNQAYQTVTYCFSKNTRGAPNTAYADVGLMGETVLGFLLTDLRRENMTSRATSMESLMKARATLWNTQAVPYGSEMAWDSTGQEGVYYWSNHFSLNSTATKTIDSILGYMPTVAHWGWNGNARRYWDNIYGGALQRIERQIHHYGSALNSLPLLSYYEANPIASNTYLLRVGYGGNSAPLSNIDQQGFASASFHSWPDTLHWDAYSGDYGPGFLGLVLGSTCFVVDDPDLGLTSFGGNLQLVNEIVKVQPRDAVRKRVYLAPFGTSFEIDAGAIEEVSYDQAGNVQIVIASVVADVSNAAKATSAVLWIEKKAAVTPKVPMVMEQGLTMERAGWKIDLGNGTRTIAVMFM